MAYSPPAGNAINFNLENSYSPPAGNAINFNLVESASASTTDLFDGKVKIKNSATDLFDGKVKIKSSDTDLFDGKVKIEQTSADLFDGKVKVKDSTADLFDGKVKVKDSTTDLFDGRVIVSLALSDTDLFDGKVRIAESSTDLFDGKVKVKSSDTDLFDGKVKLKSFATDLFDGKVVVKTVHHTDADSGISGKGETSVDSGIWGLPVPQADSGIRGLLEDLSTGVFSGIKGISTEELDVDSGLKGLNKTEAGSGIIGFATSVIGSGIIGGVADVFGFSYPLADPIPLRNTTIWGSFKNVQTIHHAYGRVRLAPIQYDEEGKLYVLADHSIQGVDEVQIDDGVVYAWKHKNTLDLSNSPVAMLELSEALPSGSSLVASIRGKVHPATGVLMTNPADILWDILANIVGAPISYADLDRFRNECSFYGIEINGLLDDRARSVKKQLDLICESIGAIWSGGMSGLARIYPVHE